MEDHASLLDKGISAFSANDTKELKKISDKAIVMASLVDDRFTVDLAVVLYACAKLLERNACSMDACKHIVTQLKTAQALHTQKKKKEAEEALHQLSETLKQQDEAFGKYVQDVMERAKLKKSATLAESGISVAQSASTLGVSQWELHNYLGNVNPNEKESQSVKATRQRLAYTRSLFGGGQNS